MAKKKNCRPSFKVSHAGHLLSTRPSSKAGKILSKDGKKEKKERRKRGCMDGTGKFQLTAKQKKNLPIALQKAILAHHRKKEN